MLKRKRRHKLGTSNTDPARFNKSQLKIYGYMIPISIVMLLPIIYIVVSAIKPMDELFAYPPRFYVKNPTFDNFRRLFEVSSDTAISAGRYLFNTFVNTVVIMFLNVWISVCVGFVLSKKTFRGKDALLQINNMALMFVQTAVAIPTYFVIVYTGLRNNFLVGIIPALVVPTGVFLVKQFIDQLPDALIEAARIDGCGEFKIMYRIAIPLCVPTIATLCLFYAVGRWNGIDDQLYYVQKTGLHTVQMALKQMIEAVNVQSEESGTTQLVAENIKAASITLSMTPMLVVYPFIQRFFTQGIMLGAVKG